MPHGLNRRIAFVVDDENVIASTLELILLSSNSFSSAKVSKLSGYFNS
jgi:hypothetical protein